MTGTERFGLVILVISLVGTVAVLSNRLSARLRVPAPAFFLVGAAVVAELWWHTVLVPIPVVQRVVTIALAIILFDGGMHIGWRHFRSAAGPIIWVGVAGTFVTAAGAAACAHFVAGLDWRLAAPRYPPPIRPWCSRSSAAGRSSAAPASCSRASQVRTTR